ncbi:MAG: DUF5069 domain-containing protein [Opitutaceae bacterium]
MKHYVFADQFRAVYIKAVDNYRRGHRGTAGFVSPSEAAFLAENGITVQHLYDYAEDDVNGGEPGYDRALAIELVRRDYFLNVQNGQASTTVLDEDSLPPKQAEASGIPWLPRIIPKARAKLRGELPASLMYSCGGDRNFFRTHDIHPAEFLSLVWRSRDHDEVIIDWVARRSAAKS